MEETIIISLGGSLIVPEDIDVEFLKDFKNLVLEHVEMGRKFVIITGGGGTNKKYNEAVKKLADPSNEDLDWIGIASLKLNAELIRVIFAEWANKKVIDDLSKDFYFEKSIIIGSAFEPGKSSDWDAIEAAKTVDAKKIINLSNTDFVYDSDPKVNPNAKKIENISWAEYRALIPKEWNPRMNSPFDPIASKIAEKEKITVITMNGKPIDNLAKCLNGEKFVGSVIS